MIKPIGDWHLVKLDEADGWEGIILAVPETNVWGLDVGVRVKVWNSPKVTWKTKDGLYVRLGDIMAIVADHD